MSWRRLPPVHSPVPAGALLSAFRRDAGEALAETLRSMFGAQHALLTDRGTSALELAIRLAGGERPVVALPAFGCYDLATAAVGADARVALYDVDPDTLGPDPDSLRRAFVAGARTAVIAVPFGYAPDWPALEAIAAESGATLIEDAAQGHGGSLGGRPLGSLGDLAVLSFGRGKGWTGGGGGALLLRDGQTPAVAAAGTRESLKTALLSTVLAVASHPALYRIPSSIPWLGIGETVYRAPAPAAAMPSSAAGILLGSRQAAEREAARRRRIAGVLAERFEGSTGLRVIRPVAGSRPGMLRFPVRLPAHVRAGILDIGHDLGIVATYPTTLADLPVLRDRRVEQAAMPGAQALVAELVTLPTHGRVRSAEADRIGRMVSGSGWAVQPAVSPAG